MQTSWLPKEYHPRITITIKSGIESDLMIEKWKDVHTSSWQLNSWFMVMWCYATFYIDAFIQRLCARVFWGRGCAMAECCAKAYFLSYLIFWNKKISDCQFKSNLNWLFPYLITFLSYLFSFKTFFCNMQYINHIL